MIQKSDIPAVFNTLAPKYDKINRILSGYQDVRWRKKMAQIMRTKKPELLVDVATGTADVLLSLLENNIQFKQAIGIDPAVDMLAVGRDKTKAYPQIRLETGVATALPLETGCVDVMTIAFGIRNVPDYKAGLAEMARVIKPGGELLILEFSLPPQPLRSLYLIYLRHILPTIGRLVSGHPTAYRYLNTTIESFPYGPAFARILQQAGFSSVQIHPLLAGVVSIYHAIR